MDREPLGQGKAGAPSLPPTSSPRVMDGAGPRKPQPWTTDWFLVLARRTKSPCTHHSFPGSLLPSVHPPFHSYTPTLHPPRKAMREAPHSEENVSSFFYCHGDCSPSPALSVMEMGEGDQKLQAGRASGASPPPS